MNTLNGIGGKRRQRLAWAVINKHGERSDRWNGEGAKNVRQRLLSWGFDSMLMYGCLRAGRLAPLRSNRRKQRNTVGRRDAIRRWGQ
jgi:hypothetical protein